MRPQKQISSIAGSKLIQLLKTFTAEEFRDFGLFLRSPFHNKNDRLVRLYEYLSRFFPDHCPTDQKEGLIRQRKMQQLLKTQIYSYLFPNQTYSSYTINNLMSKLLKLAKSFLLIMELSPREQQSEDYPAGWESIWIQIYEKRQLDRYFHKYAEKFRQKIEAKSLLESKDYLQLSLLEEAVFFHPNTQKFAPQANGLLHARANLQAFYKMQDLKLACEMASRKNIIHAADDTTELPSLSENRLYRIYAHLLQLHECRRDDSLFQQIKNESLDISEALPQGELYNIFQQLENYAVRIINQQDDTFAAELFVLYQSGLKAGIYTPDQRITDATFTNMAFIGANLQKFEWVEQFIANYQKYLNEEIKEQAVQLASIYADFQQEKYEEVFSNSLQLRYLPSYGFRIMSLRIRSIYEMLVQGESVKANAFTAAIAAFKSYIKSNKQVDRQRESMYWNFLGILQQLIRYKGGATLQEKKNLFDKLNRQQPIVCKSWLKQKIQQIPETGPGETKS